MHSFYRSPTGIDQQCRNSRQTEIERYCHCLVALTSLRSAKNGKRLDGSRKNYLDSRRNTHARARNNIVTFCVRMYNEERKAYLALSPLHILTIRISCQKRLSSPLAHVDQQQRGVKDMFCQLITSRLLRVCFVSTKRIILPVTLESEAHDEILSRHR